MENNKIDMMNNVIGEKEYKERISLVFNDMANIVKCTYGPYGSTTVIEKSGDVMFTKDGHQTLKRIVYRDNVQNALMDLIFKIATQVAIKVGDGTTTATIAADQLLQKINENEELNKIRPKEFMDLLNKAIELICSTIQKNAIEIDKEGDLNEIYKLAYVSTNGDSNIAEMIRTIYKETGNSAIEYNKSKSNNTTYEIVDGYKMKFMTYIDRIFINKDDGTCNIDRPKILMFNHKVEQNYYDKIIKPALDKAVNENKKLVIIAPYYDKYLLQTIQRTLTLEYKARQTTSSVYLRCGLMNNAYIELFGDFAALTGGTIINEQTAYDICKDNLEFIPEEYFGEVENMIVADHSTFISGFTHKNEAMLKILMDDAISKYIEVMEASEKNSIITDDMISKKQRIAKLKCKMGTINVGGYTELQKSANFDLVEDAVKACESAYLYGYVPGQSVAIQKAIQELLETDISKELKTLLESIYDAFIGVFRILLNNKFKDIPISQYRLEQLVSECIKENSAIDIEQLNYIEVDNSLASVIPTPNYHIFVQVEFNKDIINSCMTDIEILKAASSIVGLLTSSNQFITLRVEY